MVINTKCKCNLCSVIMFLLPLSHPTQQKIRIGLKLDPRKCIFLHSGAGLFYFLNHKVMQIKEVKNICTAAKKVKCMIYVLCLTNFMIGPFCCICIHWCELNILLIITGTTFIGFTEINKVLNFFNSFQCVSVNCLNICI